EKYRMPAIQLTEDAKVLLLAYSWPGNVRQLKNITEQISIIETNRDITAEILRNYLPEQHVNSGLPALFGVKANTGKAFESEREILYQVLFDMRRDVTDLKKLVNTLMAERGAQSVPTAPATTAVSYYQEPQRNLVATVVPATPTIISAAKPAHPVVDDIQDTEEVVEEATLSLDEVEKEMIRKALDRHHGKRKNAAKDLNISERTLYRKIKEYGLD
ncbi:helix-turn-helix domain-containing protein, partial [Phocaeicola vulgatus]